MSASAQLQREQIEQQAALWTARLETGGLSAAEQQALGDWLAADPEHRWVLSRYRELCATLAAQVPVLMDRGEVETIVARAARGNRLRRRLGPILAAAAVLAVAALGWGLRPEKVETRGSERRALALDDGSRVELNARTSLKLDLGREARRIRLARGEALFQVTRDAARPFLVETPRGTIRVTGTVFNVRETASGAVEVTVLEGTVQVLLDEASFPTALAAGDQAVLGGTEVTVQRLSLDDAQNVLAWRTGQAAFVDSRLDEALARFAPYHAGPVTLSAEAAALRVGGRYSLDDREGFLAAIEQAIPISVLRGEHGAVRIVAHPRPAK